MIKYIYISVACKIECRVNCKTLSDAKKQSFAGKECNAVGDYYADCFGEMETESESSSSEEEAIDESTAVSGPPKRGNSEGVPPKEKSARFRTSPKSIATLCFKQKCKALF